MSSSSRAQSQSSRYSRKRSNTAQSAYKYNASATPLLLTAAPSVKVGESKTLAAWVHDQEKSPTVILNHNWWPGINEGDLLRVTLGSSDSGFLFFVTREDYSSVKPQLQVRVFLSPVIDGVELSVRLGFQDIYPRKYRRGIRYKEQRRNHGHEGTQRGKFEAFSIRLGA